MFLNLLDNGAMMHIRVVMRKTSMKVGSIMATKTEMRCMAGVVRVLWHMRLNNNVLVGKSCVPLFSKNVSRFPKGLNFMSNGGNLVGEGEVLILDSVELGSDVLVCSREVAQIVGQSVVYRFQVVDLSGKSGVGDGDVVQFNSGAVKLGVDISKSCVQMGDLVGEGMVGLLKVMASGFTSME